MVARTHRRTPLAIVLALAAALTLTLTLTSGVGPAHAAKASSKKSATYKTRTCRLSERDRFPRGGKPTYNTRLKVKRSSCTTARKVMKAYHRCRSTRSIFCRKRVERRWRCSSRRTSRIKTMFNASYTCKWGTRRVYGRYQQNT